MGLGRLELPTSPLSGARSSQLSYKPAAASLGGGGVEVKSEGVKGGEKG